VEEIFYQNLSTNTQIELARQGIHTVGDAIKVISQTEEVLIKTYIPQTNNSESNIVEHQNKFEKKFSESKFKRHSDQNVESGKWCSFHKSKSHNTNECRKLNEEKEKQTDRKSYSLIEPRPRIGVIKLDTLVNDKPTTSLLDTGSTYTYIPESFIDRLNLKPQDTKPITSQTADGRDITVSKLADFNLKFSSYPMYSIKLQNMC
jgi:hypothetical protein